MYLPVRVLLSITSLVLVIDSEDQRVRGVDLPRRSARAGLELILF